MKQLLSTASVVTLLLSGAAFAQGGAQPNAGADVKVQQQPAQVTVQQPAPHITVTQPNPDVKVTQPKPEVTVTPTKPDVTVQQAKPDVTVTQQKPEVTVQQKPDVNMQKPAVDKAAAADHRPLATDVQSLIGKEVYGQNGNHVGEIRNLLIGPGNRVQAAVIEFGGFLGIGENQVAVDWDRLNIQPNRVTVNMTDDQIKSAPHWRKDEPGRFADAHPLR